MGNVFKSVAKFLDNALSGGEVDVIVLEEKPLDAAAVTGELVIGDAGAADASNENEDSSDENALDNAGDAAADGGEASGEADENAGADGDEAGDGGEADNADAGAETASMPSVRQVLGEGQVAIGAVELEGLRADAAKWKENATELETLRAWKVTGSKDNVLQGAVDTADAVTAPAKKVSAATQKAIDLKNKMAGN